MAAPLLLKPPRLALSLLAALAAGGVLAQVPSPEPDDPLRTGESAKPAVDLAKLETDAKLAGQARTNQTKSHNNLKQLGLAFHNFNDTYRRLPDDIADKKGKALLSWRVALLPFLEQDKLYREFRLGEPWDSAHNIKLLERMPDVYRSARVRLSGKGNTVYQVFRGPNAVFGTGRPARIPASFPDGTSNTILAVEATAAVPWTKPADLAFDRTKAVPDFGKAYGKKPLGLMADGSVRVLDLGKISQPTLKNAIDPSDGQVLGPDWKE
jgi:hypothetical protein